MLGRDSLILSLVLLSRVVTIRLQYDFLGKRCALSRLSVYLNAKNM